MAGEILHVTGHEEQNVKKRYSSTPRPLHPRERATVLTVQAAELAKAAQ